MREEVVVRRSVQPRTWAANIRAGVRRNELVRCVARRRDLVATLAIARQSVLRIVVWVLGSDRGSGDVISIERACRWTPSTLTRLLTSPETLSFEKSVVNAWR